MLPSFAEINNNCNSSNFSSTMQPITKHSRIKTVNEDLIKSIQIYDEAAEICSTSKVSFESVSPVVFLSKYFFGSRSSFENISTRMLMTTLFDIHELVLIDIKENNELNKITVNRITEQENADELERLSENNPSTIWPVISGIDASKTVANAIIIETKINFPM